MTGVILMIVGGLVWLAGELLGASSKRKNDTTSEFVWWVERSLPGARIVFGVLFAWLGVHLVFGTPLVPLP